MSDEGALRVERVTVDVPRARALVERRPRAVSFFRASIARDAVPLLGALPALRFYACTLDGGAFDLRPWADAGGLRSLELARLGHWGLPAFVGSACARRLTALSLEELAKVPGLALGSMRPERLTLRDLGWGPRQLGKLLEGSELSALRALDLSGTSGADAWKRLAAAPLPALRSLALQRWDLRRVDWAAPLWQRLEHLDVRRAQLGVAASELGRLLPATTCLAGDTFVLSPDEAAVEAEEA